jgi:quinolinate synthase
VILAHNYQVPEIQDVADYVGDSLGLSQQAAKTPAEVIVFCGVHFMAETAKILNPHKIVVLPDKDAGCSLEQSCPAPKLKEFQATNPNFYTIAYINCSAGVKALSDVICTSGNAVKIVNAAPKDKDLLFVPDENLGSWVMEQTGRPMTLWRGDCYVHVEWTHASITRIRREFPDAPLVAHPECTKAVRMLADIVCSTEKDGGLLQKVAGQTDHHCHRGGHAPSPPKGMPGQNLYSGADRQLPLQRVSLHENEHARKGLQLHGRPAAADRTR